MVAKETGMGKETSFCMGEVSKVHGQGHLNTQLKDYKRGEENLDGRRERRDPPAKNLSDLMWEAVVML